MTLSDVFKEDWLVVIIDYNTKQKKVIVNNRSELSRIYQKLKNDIWIGYNSRQYDQFILKGILLNMNPKEINDKLIIEGKKGHEISRKFNTIPFITYDCILLNKSLKQLELFMGSDIKETDVDFNIDRKLTQSEIEETIKYCTHDVEETIKVFDATKNEFTAHLGLIQKFNLPMEYFGKTKAKLSAEILSAERQHGLDDALEHSFLDTIRLGKYQHIMEWFDTHRSYTYVNEKGTTKKMQLTTPVMGLDTVYGYGGCHGAIKKYSRECGENELIIHSDVASFYPNIMINYNLLSRAVKEPQKFKDIVSERLELKRLGKKKEQAPLKVVIRDWCQL